jgi:phospholipid N-methyltransferase
MNYLLKIGTTGAIGQTPKNVLKKIGELTARLPDNPRIMEAGAGTGEITEVVLDSLNGKEPSSYYAFEIDDAAIQELSLKLPNISAIQGDVFNFEEWTGKGENFDLFISSIPLSFYGLEKTGAWLDHIKQLPGARLHSFLTFPQYFMIHYQHRR